MKQSLEEYAAQHPQENQPQEQAAILQSAQAYREREQAREDVTEIKASILRQLQEGCDPVFVLYRALWLIGLMTDDEEWTEAAQQPLDRLYEGLEQQSLLVDNATIAAQRLEAAQQDYLQKLFKKLNAAKNGYDRLSKALDEAMKAAELLPK